ncbi:MAG: murein L,D-transpeptidase [Paracoccaceae bacterium]
MATAASQVVRLSPAAAEIRKVLIAGGRKYASLKEFYAARNFEPVWTGRSKSASRALLKALSRAGEHGLPVARYAPDDLSRLLSKSRRNPDKARAEIAASLTFLKYAHDVGSGLINPRRIDSEISLKRPRRSDLSLLTALAGARRPDVALKKLQPSHPNYARLLEEKKRLEKVVRRGGWGKKVPAGDTLKPGMKSRRIPFVRARLVNMKIARGLGASQTYDSKLEAAVKKFQLRFGLNADGVIGRRTLAAMNIAASQRLGQVVANLERERWMNFDRGSRHVYVNLAAFTVTLYDNGKPIYSSRVVAGKAKDFKTPEFSDKVTHLVVNPSWHVPDSIATEELLPAIQKDPAFLANNNMRIISQEGVTVNPDAVDFSEYSTDNFPYVIKQAPSGGNALGRVKFMFPNRFNIYLHDTPAKRLFTRDVRAFSHGCVRVQKPFEFAYILLAPQLRDPKATFARWLATGEELFVNLARPVPIHLSYNTAWVDPNGTPQFRFDVYGRDSRLLRALRKAGVSI